MQLHEIDYKNLNSRQKEIFNFQNISGLLANYGFNCIKLADDWQGADLLAYHKDGLNTLKVQLKSRLAIYKKYKDKELFVAFHLTKIGTSLSTTCLSKKVGQDTPWLKTNSWVKKGYYHSKKPSKKLLLSLSTYKLLRR